MQGGPVPRKPRESALERQPGAVDRRIRGRPAGHHDADESGNAARVIGQRPRQHRRIARIAAQLHDVEDRGGDPRDVVTEIHARRARDAVPGFPRVAQDGKIGHADVHRHVAEPGEEHRVPEGELDLARQRIAAGPDRGLGLRPQIPQRPDAELAQADEAKRDEHQHHPRRRDVRDVRHEHITVGGHDRDRRADHQHRDDPRRRYWDTRRSVAASENRRTRPPPSPTR